MNSDGVLDRIMQIGADVAGPARTPGEVRSDTPLRDGGFWLDSVDLLELVVACEGEFDLDFDPATRTGRRRQSPSASWCRREGARRALRPH